MEFLTTEGLPKIGRASAWGELYASRMSQCVFTPRVQDNFEAQLHIGQLGPVKLARLTLDDCSVERTQKHITRNAPRLYNFLLQARGSSVFRHCGHEAHLEEGDFVLCDTGLPHHFSTAEQSETVMVRVPDDTLRIYLPTPDKFCGQRLGRTSGLTGTVAAMVRELSSGTGGTIDHNSEDRVARYLLELMSLAYTTGTELDGEASAIAWRRRKDVIQYIEENLRDPDLTPAKISEGLGVSSRYLRTVFASGNEKMGAFILRRRLEECARQMGNPAWKAHTLTEIAFSWGFNSAAHFTRTFHEKYSMAPREYRRVSLAQYEQQAR
ncbi:AraC-like ligand-binding domain-containing protein [Aurantiacibacter poecillastricola]|uniref:AraC-like ligand-binding domain-containing protein n=1 Tax=Aurantiacibacter poecillastricola TaxID=3064385 RepID=UPI00273D176E|nr:helix-turn-helix domain-containing protein [Aurantiacibacter sp. 219JJ12-13]MDP5263252.1 helix-turn-helix domain-containing protein [Aurantiacibacter sp. 219JJ12-13]